MPEIVADPPSPSCYRLFLGRGIEEFQRLGPDPFLPRAHAREGASPCSADRSVEGSGHEINDNAVASIEWMTISLMDQIRRMISQPAGRLVIPANAGIQGSPGSRPAPGRPESRAAPGTKCLTRTIGRVGWRVEAAWVDSNRNPYGRFCC
jgi:hypothetical protein